MSVMSFMTRLLRLRLGILAVLAMAAVLIISAGAEGAAPATTNHYVGADKCQLCHNAKEKGDQYAAWKKMKHAGAYATLATDKAKEAGKKAGIENPQADPKCLACHETGYGEPKENFAKSFKDHQGIQCETCHGPGENHVSARLKAAEAKPAGGDEGFGFEGGEGDKPKAEIQKVPAGEILTSKDETTCIKCHNEKSPHFPGKFIFEEMSKKVMHKDPRKEAAAPK